MSAILVASSSSGIIPQSLSRVSILWGSFPIDSFIIVIVTGAHLVELYVEFLLGELAQEPVLSLSLYIY